MEATTAPDDEDEVGGGEVGGEVGGEASDTTLPDPASEITLPDPDPASDSSRLNRLGPDPNPN